MSLRKSYFAADYATARESFTSFARAAGAVLDGYRVPGQGPAGEKLRTDIAWLGDAQAERVLLVQSGVHGVEAFAGSAVQCSLLDPAPELPEGSAMVLVHVVNPFGMAWLRRVNGSNVDLNRNCLQTPAHYSGSPPGYDRLARLINPASPPRRDFFLVRAAYALARLGRREAGRAVAQGQYEHPAGLFYGGARREPETTLLKDWLEAHLAGVDRLLVLDLHTGLGRFGEQLVIPAWEVADGLRGILQSGVSGRLVAGGGSGEGYPVTGSISSLYREACKDPDLQYFTVEFGSYSLLKIVGALRDENRHHFYSGGGVEHRSKRALKRALCPDSDSWRERVVASGRKLAEAALAGLEDGFGGV